MPACMHLQHFEHVHNCTKVRYWHINSFCSTWHCFKFTLDFCRGQLRLMSRQSAAAGSDNSNRKRKDCFPPTGHPHSMRAHGSGDGSGKRPHTTSSPSPTQDLTIAERATSLTPASNQSTASLTAGVATVPAAATEPKLPDHEQTGQPQLRHRQLYNRSHRTFSRNYDLPAFSELDVEV